jgi:hypothetical protein
MSAEMQINNKTLFGQVLFCRYNTKCCGAKLSRSPVYREKSCITLIPELQFQDALLSLWKVIDRSITNQRKPLHGIPSYPLFDWIVWPRNTNREGGLSTVDLLIKVPSFVKTAKNIFNTKRSWSKLVSRRRSIVLRLPFQ